eukprot:366303-Chlamydomonas_euryale.AAC.3
MHACTHDTGAYKHAHAGVNAHMRVDVAGLCRSTSCRRSKTWRMSTIACHTASRMRSLTARKTSARCCVETESKTGELRACVAYRFMHAQLVGPRMHSFLLCAHAAYWCVHA